MPSRRPRLTWTTFDSPVLSERFADTIRPALGDVAGIEVVTEAARTQGVGYYRGAAIGLRALDDAHHTVDLGDGGVTGWTADLRGDAKERCVVSCIAPERLSELAG